MDPTLALLEILRYSEVADLVAGRIHARVTNDTLIPAIEVTDLGGTTIVRGHIDACLVQVDIWGLEHEKAALRLIADTARAVLAGVENFTTSSAVVTDVAVAPPTWLPEDEPGLSHYVLTAVATIHPTPA